MRAEVFHQIYLHFVWSTLQRVPLLTEGRGDWVTERIQVEAEKREAWAHARYTMPDHVHLLVSLPPSIAPSNFIGQVKGAVAFAYNREFGIGEKLLEWQQGFGVLSLRASEKDRVAAYIHQQPQRHTDRQTHTLWATSETTASSE